MTDKSSNNTLLLSGGLLLGGVASMAIAAHVLKRIPTTILQHPSQAPGRWEKTVVIGYDNTNFAGEPTNVGYRVAIFDNGVDFVSDYKDPKLTKSQAQQIINEYLQQGYVSRDVKMWGEHYGVSE